MNQEAVDLTRPDSPVVQAGTTPSINPINGSVDTLLPSSFNTPSCTPVPLELHIDEDGSSTPTALSCSNVVIASSKSLHYSQIKQSDDSGSVISEISHVESLSISRTANPPFQTEGNSPTHMSVTKVSSPLEKSSSPVVVSKSPSPVTVSMNHSPILKAKSPSPPDLKFSSLSQSDKSPSPIHKNNSPVPVSHSTELKTASPVTIPRLASPVPKSASPVPVPAVSSPITIPISASPDTVPKCASPVSIPRLSSPVPKTASPYTSVPKCSSPETLPKNTSPIILPRLSSPVTVPKTETVVPKSPALVTRKIYSVQSTSSPRASPVQLAAVPSKSLSPPPSERQGGDVLDLTWPCREPLLDDALNKLLTADTTQLSENQPPAFIMPGDDYRSWEEDDGISPDLSREGTLTPMTESSWMDECFTPSTCPGTPDAMLELPSQQPSAVERLSASGQVGRST